MVLYSTCDISDIRAGELCAIVFIFASAYLHRDASQLGFTFFSQSDDVLWDDAHVVLLHI
jgi:hypothetical protein